VAGRWQGRIDGRCKLVIGRVWRGENNSYFDFLTTAITGLAYHRPRFG